MKVSEKIALYRRFTEGCETEDAVRNLLTAASILNGIGAVHETALTILVVENLIRDYMKAARNRLYEWEDYEAIDAELYSFILGGARKLTEAEYCGFEDNK